MKYLRELSRKWRIFQDVYFVQKDGTMQIDYLVISRQGVFLIETKNWEGTPVGNETDSLWTLHYPGGYKEKVQNPVADVYAKARFLARTARVPENLIHPILSFGGMTDTYYLNVYDKVQVVYHQELVGLITQYP